MNINGWQRDYPATAYLVLLAIFLWVPAANSDPASFDAETENLSYCTGVIAYAANLSLMHDNPGRARTLVLQGARASTSLFFKHSKNGLVMQADADAFRQVSRRAKPYLDANSGAIETLLATCLTIVDDVAKRESDRHIRVFGKSFYQMATEMAEQALRGYGL